MFYLSLYCVLAQKASARDHKNAVCLYPPLMRALLTKKCTKTEVIRETLHGLLVSGSLGVVLAPCTCFRKTLLIFPNSGYSQHEDKVEQVQAPDQSKQDKSFHNQNICNKQGLQIDKCRPRYNDPMVYKQNR